jgi:hypothetical protein
VWTVPRHGTFHYDIRARCSVADAVALLADIPRLTSRHPLAVGVKAVPPGDGALRSTEVTSRLTWGPLRFHITYRADLLTVTDDEVVTVAHQRPRTTLVNRARFRAEDGGVTHIAVEITFTSPALLFPYAFGRAKFAHAGLATGIKHTLEAQPNSVDDGVGP